MIGLPFCEGAARRGRPTHELSRPARPMPPAEITGRGSGERHGVLWGYSGGCRCEACRRAKRQYARFRAGVSKPDGYDDKIDKPWVLLSFPVAIVARQAFPDDAEAIRAAFGATS